MKVDGIELITFDKYKKENNINLPADAHMYFAHLEQKGFVKLDLVTRNGIDKREPKVVVAEAVKAAGFNYAVYQGHKDGKYQKAYVFLVYAKNIETDE